MTQAQNPVDVQRHLAQANSFGSNNTYDSFFSMAIDDDNLLDCFIHLPAQQGVPFQMDFKTISEAQLQDAALLQEAHANPQKLSQQLLAPNTQVYCYTAQPGGSWKIYLDCSKMPSNGITCPLGMLEFHVWSTPSGCISITLGLRKFVWPR